MPPVLKLRPRRRSDEERKQARREYDHMRYLQNPDAFIERNRAYDKQHPDAARKRCERYRKRRRLQ